MGYAGEDSRPRHTGALDSGGLENVSQEALGVGHNLFSEADRLIEMGLLTYKPFDEAAKTFAETHPAWKAERIDGDHQSASIFYGEGEVILAFEGSEFTDPSHWYRNLFQSRIGNKRHVYKPEMKDRSALLRDPELQRLAAHIADQRGHPETADIVAQDLVQAAVHGGWCDVLDKPTHGMYPPDVNTEGQTFWQAIQARLDHALSTQPGATLEFAGHSSGGAYATIAAARWMIERNKPVGALYTFGQPRVGGPHFRDTLHALFGKDVPPYYRFELLGDPIPSLPPLRPNHFVHGGQWICLSHNGALIGATQPDGTVITAAESAQAGNTPMSSQQHLMGREKLAQFVRATERQMDEIMQRWGGNHVGTDGVFSSITHTLLDLPAHFRGESGRVHSLAQMQAAVQSQMRKQALKDSHSELRGVVPLGAALLQGADAVKAAHENNVIALDEENLASLKALDQMAQTWVSSFTPDNPGSSIIINQLAAKLVHGDDGKGGPLERLTNCLAVDAPKPLQEQITLLRDAVSDYLDRHTSVMPARGMRL